MNAIICLTTISALFLGFCDSSLTKAPSDSSVLVGDNVTLECFTEDKTYPPTWSHQKVGSATSRDVSLVFKRNDGDIGTNMMEGYHERHEIFENRETGEYSLIITNVKAEDAGVYACTSRGGLGQKAPAKLTVFEASPICETNVTEAVGENSCGLDPDYIQLSCKFRVHGNVALSTVTWMDTKHPETVIKIDNPKTDDAGITASKFIIRGDYPGLDTASFSCIVDSTGNTSNQRLSCTTPSIAVLRVSNLTQSKTLTEPDEVECKQFPELHTTGCKWIRRNDGEKNEAVVSERALLNLHRPDMEAGTYVCIVNCKIRGHVCPIEALTVTYRPAQSSHTDSGPTTLIAILIAVIGFISALIGFVVWYFVLRRRPNEKGSQENNLIGPANGSSQNRKRDECDEGTGLRENHDVGVDMPDVNIGRSTSREDRIRLTEEKARARMKENAERNAAINSGVSPDQENTDVAEGITVGDKKNQ